VTPPRDGGLTPSVVPREQPSSYYGRPIIKEPTWTWEIPWYLFAGGLAGASTPLAVAAEVAGNRQLSQRAWVIALGALGVSPVLLILDLGRPERFLHMLRVFKPTSPMSMGTWTLVAISPLTGLATARSVLGWFPRLGLAAGAGAAVLGPSLATYTGVLLSDTAVPIWHEAGRHLPWVFAGTATMSAGAAVTLASPPDAAGPARRLAVGGAVWALVAAQRMERHLGELAEPYRSGPPHRLLQAAELLMAGGAAAVAVGGRRRRGLTAAGAAALVAGAASERWAVFKAGFVSARDPKYTVGPQRKRLAARGGVPSARHPTGSR
jgi:DMSO reductase anchor subunit